MLKLSMAEAGTTDDSFSERKYGAVGGNVRRPFFFVA